METTNNSIVAETSSKVDEAFDKMMEQADIKVEDPSAKLTDEQVQHISDSIENVVKDNDVQKVINELPSNNGVQEAPINVLADPAKGSVVNAKVNINPVLGAANMESAIPDDDDIPAVDLNDYLNMADYENGTLNLEGVELSASIKKEYNLSDEDAAYTVELLKKVQKKEEFTYYESLPDSLKKYCRILLSAEAESNIPTTARLNAIAFELLNTITSEVAADKFTIDVSDIIDSEIKKSGADLSSIYEGMIIGKADKLREAADKTEAEGHQDAAATLRKMADACEESYMMTGFVGAIKNHKIKIRKIDIEKPQKVVRDFNHKYEDSKIGINNVWDLSFCIPRNLSRASEKVDPDKITMNTIKAFIVGFCRYCDPMKITNIEDHIFMYYFIKNLLYLDTTAPGAAFSEFGQQLIDRVKSILETIHEVYGY